MTANALRPRLTEELLVNERIFGRCNHERWASFDDKHGNQVLTCNDCGEEFTYRWGGEFADEPTLKPHEYLRSRVRRYSQEEVLANLTMRQMEAGGWQVLVRSQQGNFKVEVSRGDKVFCSSTVAQLPWAMCQVAAELAKSGLFSVPT